MHNNNFLNIIMRCFQVIAGQTWQNVTSRKIDRKCQMFSVTSPQAQYAYNQWQIMKIQQAASLR